MTKMHQKVRTTNGRQVMRVTSAIRRFTPQLLEGLETALAEDGWDVSAECIVALEQALGRVLESRLERLGDTVDTRRQGVHEVRRSRESMQRAKKNALKILEGLFGLAERDDLGDRLRHREPKLREAETPASNRVAAAVANSEAEEVAPIPVAEPVVEVVPPPQRPGRREEFMEAPRDSSEAGAPADLAAAAAPVPAGELVSACRAGSGNVGSRPDSPHLEGAESRQAGASVHPVRKVLRWLSIVPHPVETPDKPGVSTDFREVAA